MTKFNTIFFIIFSSTLITGCGNFHDPAPAEFGCQQSDFDTDMDLDTDLESFQARYRDEELEAILDQAEQSASPAGRAVLIMARTMITSQEIITGSCWDYVDAVFKRSGFSHKNRITVARSAQAGPYLDVGLVQPGDWLYFINHSYGDVEHSSMFVAWIDAERKQALMISYAGGGRQAPARYKSYDLSSAYTVIRPKISVLELTMGAEVTESF